MPKSLVKGTKVKLEKVEGIGPKFGAKLRKAGIRSIYALLERGKTPKGRKEIAEAAGFSEGTILEWVNRADLFRIKGVGEEYSDLLERAGVDTVVELGQRDPKNLYETLVKTNETRKVVRQLPSQAQVKQWVKQAKSAKRMIEY